MRTKCRARKFSDEDFRKHVLKDTTATIKERAMFFLVKYQSIYTRLKDIGITRKKEVNFPIE